MPTLFRFEVWSSKAQKANTLLVLFVPEYKAHFTEALYREAKEIIRLHDEGRGTPVFVYEPRHNPSFNRGQGPIPTQYTHEDHTATLLMDKLKKKDKVMGDFEAWSRFCEQNKPVGEAARNPARMGHVDPLTATAVTGAQEDYADFNRTYRRTRRAITTVQSAAIILAFADFVSDVVWSAKVRVEG